MEIEVPTSSDPPLATSGTDLDASDVPAIVDIARSASAPVTPSVHVRGNTSGGSLDIEDSLYDDATPRSTAVPRGVGWMFVIHIVTMVAVNYDSGASAAVLPFLQLGCKGHAEYDPSYPCLDSYGQGKLGALPYLGLCIGCPIAGRMLQLKSERLVICVWLALNAFFTFVFGFVVDANNLFLAKFFIGVTQAAICVYLPVWVDSFALESQRNTWLGLVQGIGGLGAMVGYAISGYLTTFGVFYQWAFRIQGIWIVVCIVLLFLAPTSVISVSARSRPGSRDPVNDHHRISRAQTVSMINSKRARHFSMAVSRPDAAALSFAVVGALISEEDSGGEEEVAGPRPGTCAQVGPLFKNGLFIYTALGLCCLFFVVTGVQFWATKFFILIYKRGSVEVTSIFLFVSITAPVVGVLAGGAIVDRQTQGAMEPTARIVRSWGCIAVVAGIATALVPINSEEWLGTCFYIAVLFLWVLLFFGAMMLAPCTGIILMSVQEHEKTMANAFSMVLYNTLGYALGAGLPGQISGMLIRKGWSERDSLHFAMQVVFIGGALVGLVFTSLMYHAASSRTEP